MLPYSSTIRKDRIRSIFAIENLNNKQSLNKEGLWYVARCRGRGIRYSEEGELQFEGALNYEGCRLSPGTEKNPYGQITVAHDLTINQAIYVAYRPFL